MGRYFNNNQKISKKTMMKRNPVMIMDSSRQSLMLLGVMALRDEFGFGEVRMKRFVNRTYELVKEHNIKMKPLKNRKESDFFIDKIRGIYMDSMAMALEELYGFKAERLERFRLKMVDICDSFNRDYITVDDLRRTIKEEVGVEI